MKYFKKICLCLLAGFSSLTAWSQAQIALESEVANMGELMFKMPGNAEFVISNTGTEDLQITEVNPSCGCTLVEWPEEPIPPGGKGVIQITYDALMLGVFQKDVEVYTNASEEPFYLHIQGRVVSKLSNYEGLFPIQMGTLRLNKNNIEFDNINKGDKPVAEIALVNTSRESYIPQLMHLPPYLQAQYLPEKLSGGRIGRILLTLDSERLPQMGLNQTSIYLSREMGDVVGEDNEIMVSAILLPDFSELSKSELEQAPQIRLSADSLDLGSIPKWRKKTSGTIWVENTGKSPLEIRTIQVFNKAISIQLSDRVIQPGERVRLKITAWDEYLKKAKNKPRVLLITNDPKQPKKIITVRVQANKEK